MVNFFVALATAISGFFGSFLHTTPPPSDNSGPVVQQETPATQEMPTQANSGVTSGPALPAQQQAPGHSNQTVRRKPSVTATEASQGESDAARSSAQDTSSSDYSSSDTSSVDTEDAARNDAQNLTPIKGNYQKGQQFIFYVDHGMPSVVSGADRATFQVLSDEYAKDRAHVYFRGDTLAGADPATFSFISIANLAPEENATANEFTKDRTHVYCNGQLLPEADPATFSFFQFYGKDSRYVYSLKQSSCVKIDGSDGGSFQYLGHGWGKDKNGVYTYVTDDTGYLIFKKVAADPASFTVLSRVFGKDSSSIYFAAEKIGNVDPATFSIINDSYVKDASHVYVVSIGWGGDEISKIKGADPSTFVPLSPHFKIGKDKAAVYVMDSADGGIDPGSFHFLPPTSTDNKSLYAADTSNVYYGEQGEGGSLYMSSVSGANMSSFRNLDGRYAKDSDEAYYGGYPIDNADPSSFEIVQGSKTIDAKDKNYSYYHGESVQ